MTMATEIKSRMSSVPSSGAGAGKTSNNVNIHGQGKPVENSGGGCC